MQTQWNTWLAAEKAAGRGGAILFNPSIKRGKAWSLPMAIPGDLTGATFTASFHVSPAAPPIAGLSVAVDVAAFDDEAGTTLVTLSLAATETDSELPPDSDFDGVGEVILKADFTPAGGSDALPMMGLVIPVVE